MFDEDVEVTEELKAGMKEMQKVERRVKNVHVTPHPSLSFSSLSLLSRFPLFSLPSL